MSETLSDHQQTPHRSSFNAQRYPIKIYSSFGILIRLKYVAPKIPPEIKQYAIFPE